MSKVVPTILTNNLDFFHQFNTTYSSFAKRIQIDICDKDFVSISTISENDIDLLNPENIAYDFHMMVKKPSVHLDRLISLRPNLVILHAECSENLLPIFNRLKTAGVKVGVAILKTTYPGNIKPYIEAADHALVFAGRLGQQGGTADILQLEKIPIIRSIKQNIEIGWDGGANMTNIRELAHGDIDVINVGSALSRSSNPSETYKELCLEADRNGVLL